MSDFARAARGHWGVENELHWTLDVAFRDLLGRMEVENSAGRSNLHCWTEPSDQSHNLPCGVAIKMP